MEVVFCKIVEYRRVPESNGTRTEGMFLQFFKENESKPFGIKWPNQNIKVFSCISDMIKTALRKDFNSKIFIQGGEENLCWRRRSEIKLWWRRPRRNVNNRIQKPV